MSQPPFPYSPQQFPPDFSQYQAAPDPLAPARRAGVMLLIVGALMIALGTCGGMVGFMIPLDQLNQVIAQSHVDTAQFPPGMAPAEFMRDALIGAAVLCVPLGIVTIVAGLFTRRSARWAIISGIVLCALPLLYLVFSMLTALARGTMNPQMLVSSLCMICIPAALLTLTLIWLIAALRRFPGIQYAQQQYQWQMWQYQQQQAAYQQNPVALPPAAPPATANDPWQRGYGMTPPPPPRSNAPPPPPGA